MATIFFMKFNQEQGALVSDETTWHLGFKYGYRPSKYGDSILNLLDKDFSSKHNFVAVYGGVGFPSFHFEVARLAKFAIKSNTTFIGDLDKVSSLVEDAFQKVHTRFINDKLNFLFGFGLDQLNSGKFDFNGKSYEIKQEAVINEAKRILKFKDKSSAYKRIFDNEGLVMGYDKNNGIRAYHISNQGRALDFAYPFDAIGFGKEIGTKIFADINYRMQLEERRRGFNFSDGLFILMNCFVEAYDFNIRTGGYLQLFMIDGKREIFKDLTCEINDHRSFLSAEVIRAYRFGYIKREVAQNFIDKLLIYGENWELIEEELFKEALDPIKLKKYLMGYKPTEVPNKPLL